MNEEWCVRLVASGELTAYAHVTAESEEEANEKAKTEACNGNVVWKYDGTIDGTIEVLSARRT